MIFILRLHDRRETLDRRRHEVKGLILAVLAGQFLSKRRRERRRGYDRRLHISN